MNDKTDALANLKSAILRLDGITRHECYLAYQKLEKALAAPAEGASAEAAERDAARWRFVSDHWHDLCTSTGLDAQKRYAVTEVFIGVGEHESFAKGSLDSAIDAAIAAQQAEGEA